MRNPDRLLPIYTELAEIHKKSFPDQREGQYLLNLLGYIASTKKRDPFFIGGPDLIAYAKEYANDTSPWFRGWDLPVYKNKE